MVFSDNVTSNYNDLIDKLDDLKSQDINSDGLDDRFEMHAALKSGKIILRNIETKYDKILKTSNNKKEIEKIATLHSSINMAYSQLYKSIREAAETEKSISQSERMKIMLELSDLVEISTNNKEASRRLRKRDKIGSLYSGIDKEIIEKVSAESMSITKRDISSFSKEEAIGVLDYLNDNKININKRKFSFQKVGSDSLGALDDKSEINIFQEELIKKILGSENLEEKGYNDTYVLGYNDFKGNYITTIGKFESEISDMSKKIKDINSKELENYFLYLENKGELNEKFFNIFNGEQIKELQEIWSEKENSHIEELLKSVGVNIFKIEISKEHKKEVKKGLEQIDKINNLPNEYFLKEENLEIIYFITNKNKLLEVIKYINDNKGLENNENYDFLDFHKLKPEFQNNYEILKFINISSIKDISSITNGFFDGNENMSYLISKINILGKYNQKEKIEIIDRLCSKAIIVEGKNIEDIKFILNFHDINSDNKYLSPYIKYKVFGINPLLNIENKIDSSYSLNSPAKFKESLPNFIKSYQYGKISYEDSDIKKYFDIYGSDGVKEYIPELLNLGIIPDNITFDIDDKNLILNILNHPNNKVLSNFKGISIVEKIPEGLKNNLDIISSVILNKSISKDQIHLYMKHLRIENPNQLMYVFSLFSEVKSGTKITENSKKFERDEEKMTANFRESENIKEFFRYKGFVHLSMSLIGKDFDYINKKYERQYNTMISFITENNDFNNRLNSMKDNLIKNLGDSKDTNKNLGLIIDNFIKKGLLDESNTNKNNRIKNILNEVLQYPESTSIISRELRDLFKNEPGKLDIIIKELSIIKLKSLHENERQRASNLNQDEDFKKNIDKKYIDNNGNLLIDMLKSDIDYFLKNNTLTPEEKILFLKKKEDLSPEEKIALDKILISFIGEFNIDKNTIDKISIEFSNYLAQKRSQTILENPTKIKDILSQDNLSDEEIALSIDNLVNENIQNNEYISLSDYIIKYKEENYKNENDDLEKKDNEIIHNENNNNETLSRHIENTYENEDGTLNIKIKDGKELSGISKEEYDMVKNSDEKLNNMIKLNETLNDLNLSFIWNNRFEFIQKLNNIDPTLNISIDKGNYIDETELKKILNSIIVLTGNEKDNTNDLKSIKSNLRSISNAGLDENKKDFKGSPIEKILINKGIIDKNSTISFFNIDIMQDNYKK